MTSMTEISDTVYYRAKRDICLSLGTACNTMAGTPAWSVLLKSVSTIEYSPVWTASDEFINRVNASLRDLDDPKSCFKYDSIEEFLDSLR